MTTTPPETNTAENATATTAVADLKGSIGSAMDPVRDLLGALVVLDRYVIEDRWGNMYSFRPALSGRQQIECALRIDAFWEKASSKMKGLKAEAQKDLKDALVEAGAALASEEGKGIAWKQVMWVMKEAITDDEVRKELDVIWQTIHCDEVFEEGVHDLAVASIRAKLEEKGKDPDKAPTHVLDIFGLEAVLEGMVPFFARFGTRILDLVERTIVLETAQIGKDRTSSPETQTPLSEN